MTSAFLITAFATLFVVIDPPGCAPIYAGLTGGASHRQATVMAARACAIAAAILVVFALFGEQLLGFLHIELDSFRIAGGIRFERSNDYAFGNDQIAYRALVRTGAAVMDVNAVKFLQLG